MKIGKEHLERLDTALENLEADLEARGEELGEHVQGTERVVGILAAVMGLLALVNLYFVNDLTEEIKEMTRSMEQMTDHFSDVSLRMGSMTQNVDGMRETMGMLPIVAAQMDEISGHVETMGGDVARIRQTTVAVDGRIDLLNRDMLDMAGRFRGVNRNVGLMGRSVEQMSRPVP